MACIAIFCKRRATAAEYCALLFFGTVSRLRSVTLVWFILKLQPHASCAVLRRGSVRSQSVGVAGTQKSDALVARLTVLCVAMLLCHISALSVLSGRPSTLYVCVCEVCVFHKCLERWGPGPPALN